MTVVLEMMTLVLMGTIALAVYRIERGPTGADRMLSSMLFGTSGTALTLLLGEVSGLHRLHDMALVFALLAAVTAVAFVKRAWRAGD
ncbi:MAG: monovalent cation/H+ antiporter complex subunit F [Coriobacteriia bacterium]